MSEDDQLALALQMSMSGKNKSYFFTCCTWLFS